MFDSAQISPPHPHPRKTSYSGKRKHRLRDAGNPKRNVLTAGSYPQPGKSLIYNPTQETTGKQQEVIFKEPVATGSKCRGSKHVPIKVRQLQKNHKGTAPLGAEHGCGRGVSGGGGTGGGGRRGEKNIRPAATAQWNIKPGSFVLLNKGESRERRNTENSIS